MNRICLYLLTIVVLVSCRNDIDLEKELYPQTNPQKTFASEFTSKYGDVSPEITWMTASSNKIQADFSVFSQQDNLKFQVFTADPSKGLEYCYLLAEYSGLKGGSVATIDFDYPTGLDNVFACAQLNDSISYIERVNLTDVAANLEVDFDVENPCIEPLSYKPMKYRIGYEGFTGDDRLDFDYNDAVAEIEYVRGKDTAVVNVLAAGCICAVSLVYHRNEVPTEGEEDVLFDEIHEYLGFGGVYDYVNKHMAYLCLNTNINNTGKIGTTKLPLKEDTGKSILDISRRLYAYFTIPKRKGEKETPTSAFIPGKKGANYPQALMIADPTWKWPSEHNFISAHSSFKKWISDPAAYPLWYGGEIWKEANKNFE